MENSDIKIYPQLTAIHRKSPSYPLKQIFNYLEYDNKILDYGCGHGYDLCYLKELGVDMLSASAHKFNGPKGIGFLYIRKGTKIYPYSDGGAQEFGMRAGTENIAAIVGMAVALKKNCDEMTEITENLRRIEAQFIGTLKNAHIDFERNGSERRVPGNISISIRGASGEMLLHRLDLKGIAISTGSACDSVNTQVSHVIRAIGIPAEYAKGTIRVSFGRENTEADATAIAEALIQILAKK